MSLTFADYQHLERCVLFRSVGVDAVAEQLAGCTVRSVEADTALLEAGSSNTNIFILLEGELRVYLRGTDMPVHAVLGPGDCVGEMSLIDGQPVSAHVIASRHSRVLTISHEIVWRLVDSFDHIARNLLAIISGRVRSSNLALASVQQRALEMEQSANVDFTTGLHNRRWMNSLFPRVLQRCERDGLPTCLLHFDVDHLAQFNERFGRPGGDAALRRIGEVLADGLRAHDLIVRYNEDEFIILLQRTDVDEGALVAERLREAVGGCDLPGSEEPVHLTVSCGVVRHAAGESLDQLIVRGERTLATAKTVGGDCAEIAA